MRNPFSIKLKVCYYQKLPNEAIVKKSCLISEASATEYLEKSPAL
jgi:hypothetical protein